VEHAATRTIGPSPVRIKAEHRVADVLDWFPSTLPVFLRHGFTALKSPMLRQTLARQVTVAQASALRGVDLPTLLDDLNAKAGAPLSKLPVLSQDDIPS